MIEILPSFLGQVMLQKYSIDRVTIQINPIRIFQNKCIFPSVTCNNIRTYPHVIKFSMFIFFDHNSFSTDQHKGVNSWLQLGMISSLRGIKELVDQVSVSNLCIQISKLFTFYLIYFFLKK